jgi:hypothetical protein
MDDTAVEEYLGSVGDAVKRLQCLVELVAVVMAEGCHPSLDFLPYLAVVRAEGAVVRAEGAMGSGSVHTCFRDMTRVSTKYTRQYGVVKPRGISVLYHRAVPKRRLLSSEPRPDPNVTPLDQIIT